jgi:hypothetical protein
MHAAKIEIPMTQELRSFVAQRYHNQTAQLVDEFLVFLNTKKEAYDINRAIQNVHDGKTRDVNKLLNEL